MKLKFKNRENQFVEIFDVCGDLISDEFYDWLNEKGFFTAPASTKYHGAYEGGLFDHSLAVTEKLVSLTDKLNLQWLRPESPYIVGMFHDLCKLDAYITEVVKEGVQYFGSDDVVDGREVKFAYNPDVMLKGHGDKSIMLLSQFLTLTEEELLCIRFHMGAYEKDDWYSYDLAIKKYETVLWTHAADMYASKCLGK